jgi:AraC-like DNA-binding protein
MTSFLKLQAFYKLVNNNKNLPVSEAGHFNIIKVEDLSLPERIDYTRRSYYKVSLVNGHSKIHYADQTIEVTESALVFTNPMIPYRWERLSEQQTGLVCIFTNNFLSNIADFPVFKYAGSGVILLKDTTRFNELFGRMSGELESSYSFKYDLLRCLLMELIHEAQKIKPPDGNLLLGSNAYERITVLFAELLERQFPIELSSQRIQLNTPAVFARQLNIHVNHLNKALKEITGETTSGLINSRIIQEAKSLLKSTTWPVNEIAWALGFEESNHFSAFFKRNTGSTPKQFRQD